LVIGMVAIEKLAQLKLKMTMDSKAS
jgi:hypothetical protein